MNTTLAQDLPASERSRPSRFSLNWTSLTHTLIGISLMLLGRYVPSPVVRIESNPSLKDLIGANIPLVDGYHLLSIPPEGMAAVGVFMGVVYLWATVDTVWPSFLGILVAGMTSSTPMPAVFSQFMGNPMVVMIFFVFMFAAMIVRCGISEYVARWFLTHKLTAGRPWVLTAAILVGTYFVACLEHVTACLIIWPALYIIFNYAGFKKGDKYVTLMIVYTLMMALLCFATDVIKGGAYYLVVNLQNLAGQGMAGAFEMNVAVYLLFGFTISMISVAVMLFFMRFVFKVDVSPLKKITPELLNQNPLPPMNIQQKLILVLFGFMSLWYLAPGIIGTANPVGKFLAANSIAGSMIAVFLAVFIKIDGKPVATLEQAGTVYQWRTFFLIAAAFFLGGAMTAPATNVTLFMKYFLQQHLAGFGVAALTVFVILIGIVATNFCNSVVAGVVLTPVILALCLALEFTPGPIMACFFFIVLIAAATPAASPFAALLFDNPKWISGKDVALHTVLASAMIVAVMIVIGMPLATLMF